KHHLLNFFKKFLSILNFCGNNSFQLTIKSIYILIEIRNVVVNKFYNPLFRFFNVFQSFFREYFVLIHSAYCKNYVFLSTINFFSKVFWRVIRRLQLKSSRIPLYLWDLINNSGKLLLATRVESIRLPCIQSYYFNSFIEFIFILLNRDLFKLEFFQ